MTNEAVITEAPATPSEAAPGSRAEAYVAKKAREWKVAPATETPKPDAPAAKTTDAAKEPAKAQDAKVDQAKEVKPQGDESKEKAPDDKGKPASDKALDLEWASERMKRRLPDLLAGKVQFDAEDLAEMRERTLHKKGANELMREAAELRKQNAIALEKAAKYDAIWDDPTQRMALVRAKASQQAPGSAERTLDDTLGESAGAVIPDPLTEPEKFRAWQRAENRKAVEEALGEREAQTKAEAKRQQDRAREVEGWGHAHFKALNGTVEPDAYMSAAVSYMEFMRDNHPEALKAMSEATFQAGVSRELERVALQAERDALRENQDKSKREALRDASASSPPGVRVSVAHTPDMTTRKGRIEETLRAFKLGRYAT